MSAFARTSCIAAMLSIGAVAFAQTTGQNPAGASGQAGSPTMKTDRQTPPGDRSQTQQQITVVGCIQREAEYRQAAGSGRGGTLGTGLGVGNEFVLVNASMASGSSHTAHSGTTDSPTPGSTARTPETAGTTGATTSPASPTGRTPESSTATGTTPASEHRTPSSDTSPASASGTMTAGAGVAYALTGSREKDLEAHVGQRVEIVGTLEGGSARSSGSGMTSGSGTATSGTATAGTTAGTSTSGTPTSGTATAGASAGTTPETTPGAAGTMQRFRELQQLNVVSFRAVGGACSQ